MKGLKGKLKKDLNTSRKTARGQKKDVISKGTTVLIDGDCKTDKDCNSLRDELEGTGLFEDLEDCTLEEAGTTTNSNKIHGAAASRSLGKNAKVEDIDELKDNKEIEGTIISPLTP